MNVSNEQFNQAVQLVSEYLQGVQKLEINYEFGEERFNALTLAQKYGEDHPTLIMYVEYIIQNDLDEFAIRAAKDRNTLDTLIFCSQHLKHQGAELPEVLAGVLQNAMLDGDAQPKAIGGQAKITQSEINRKIWCLNIAMSQGLQKTRQPYNPPVTACDAVEKAALKLKIRGYGFSSLTKLTSQIDPDVEKLQAHFDGVETYGFQGVKQLSDR